MQDLEVEDLNSADASLTTPFALSQSAALLTELSLGHQYDFSLWARIYKKMIFIIACIALKSRTTD